MNYMHANGGVDPTIENASVGEYYGRIAHSLFGSSWYSDPTVVSFILNSIPLGVRNILDLCSGPGVLVEHISRRYELERYDLVDISISICSDVRDKYSTASCVTPFCGDWIRPVIGRSKYDLVIIKNALHLLSNVTERLESLGRISKDTTRIVIIETVSPNIEANTFVKELFEIADLGKYKENYFTDNSLRETINLAGLRFSSDVFYVDQMISVGEWLDNKGVGRLNRRMALDFVAKAERKATLKRAMRIAPSPTSGDFYMLRRQLCATFSR